MTSAYARTDSGGGGKESQDNPTGGGECFFLLGGKSCGALCKNQARGLVSIKICAQFDVRKRVIKLRSASRMTFRAWFYRTDPQNVGGQFGKLSGFLRNTFRKCLYILYFRSVTFVFLILDFNTFYFMEDLPENHVST